MSFASSPGTDDWHGPLGDGHRDSAAPGRTRANTTRGKSGRPDKGRATPLEPHYMQDQSYGRELRDIEHERYAQDLEDAQPTPSYSSEGGME